MRTKRFLYFFFVLMAIVAAIMTVLFKDNSELWGIVTVLMIMGAATSSILWARVSREKHLFPNSHGRVPSEWLK